MDVLTCTLFILSGLPHQLYNARVFIKGSVFWAREVGVLGLDAHATPSRPFV